MRLLLLILPIFFGCSHFAKVISGSQKNLYIKEIVNYNQNILQIKASLKIAASSLLFKSPKEQVDLIIQYPDKIYWSLRSFFGPPAMVFASNGLYFTMLNFTESNLNPYSKVNLAPQSIFEIAEIGFHPESLITLIMAKIPLAENWQIKFLGKQILLTSKKDFSYSCVFDIAKKHVLETTIINDKLGISFHAKYNHHSNENMGFPMSLILTTKYKGKSLKLHIDFLSIEINGDLVDSSIFYLDE